MNTTTLGLIRRGQGLTYATLAIVSLEALIALAAAVNSASVALLGFGTDSLIELTAALAALWRLSAELEPARRGRVEAASLRLIGACFLVLALFVAVDAVRSIVLRVQPGESLLGIFIACLSLVAMPLLARAKRAVARGLGSGALAADAQQTALCGYLSAILLGGLLLNMLLRWWWADPAAALLMTPIIAREGWQGVQGKSDCGDGCC